MTDTAQLPTPTRPKRVRWRFVVIAVLCAAAVVWMVVLLQKNVVFFKTVSQAVHDQSHDGTRTMRIGGGVVPGSIQRHDGGADFDLTEGNVTVHVRQTGSEPPLFKDCAPVVAEGHWLTRSSTTFDATRLLIKHNNNYEAPKTTGTQIVCPPDPFKT